MPSPPGSLYDVPVYRTAFIDLPEGGWDAFQQAFARFIDKLTLPGCVAVQLYRGMDPPGGIFNGREGDRNRACIIEYWDSVEKMTSTMNAAENPVLAEAAMQFIKESGVDVDMEDLTSFDYVVYWTPSKMAEIRFDSAGRRSR